MEITIADFRKNLKTYFEKALNDEIVCIDRGGVHYNLTARIPRDLEKAVNIKENHDGTLSKIDNSKPAEIRTKPIESNMGFSSGLCKIHGIPLDSRGKCLQKGCKYA